MENLQIIKEIDLGISKIMTLANLINRKTDMCCFIEDMGHIEKLTIRIHKTKKDYLSTSINLTVSYDDGKYYKDGQERLNHVSECIESLEEILKTKQIDYSNFYPVLKEVVDYYTI